jgi:2-polyprenyl-6-hydroxyphenyl methylase/3-demethylubiquinone-9 3-methyltransferase
MTAAETRFAFGENWAAFAEKVTDQRIDAAIEGLRKLFPNGELNGKPFFDIGCGSGLSMLAALRLGASSVKGIDLDIHSVETTRALLTRHAPGLQWSVEQRSVFDLGPETYPIVHSWGVLHHTGDMWRAITRVSQAVEPGGLLAIAIYERTKLCGAWAVEKRLYSVSPKPVQWAVRAAFMGAFSLALVRFGRNPIRYIREYQRNRGMRWSNDVHDWLGGYPYESASTAEIKAFAGGIGMSEVRSIPIKPSGGMFGTGCSEFVFSRST